MDTNFGSTAAAAAAGASAAQAYLPQIQTASPTTGQTVVFTADDKDRTLWLTPAGALAALTITFPTDGASRLGQIVRLGSSQVITALTLGGATILNTAATLASAGDMYSFQKVAANTWARLV